MTKNIALFITFISLALSVNGQIDTTYLKENAIRFDDPEKLNDKVYTLLSPFRVTMFGEMHGTNESAPFVSGLANLFTSKGDSVLVGLEISPLLMTKFLTLRTDSSIYQSDFFSNPPYLDGKESLAWANLISTLHKNQRVKVFFFDVDTGEGKAYERDSLMSAKIKKEHDQHPSWKVITLSGNYHNRISSPTSMTSFLKRNSNTTICSLNMEYKKGSANADFGHGLEIKQLGSIPSVFNSTKGYDRYLILVPKETNYDYNGFYYTKYITSSTMTILK